MKWIKDVDDEEQHRQQNDVHDDADSGKVGEAEATRAIDEHMGTAADGRCEADGDREHERHDERHGVASQLCGLMPDDGEKDGAAAHIADELADQ